MNPRLVKEADALSEAGYEVTVVAPDSSEWARVADEVYVDRPWKIVARPVYGPLSPRLTRIREIARRLIAGFATRILRLEHPFLVCAAWHPAAPLLVKAAVKIKADLYIAHLATALPAAAIAARHNNALYGFDAEDFHLGEFADTPDTYHKRHLVKLIESRYLKGCSYVTAASPLIADAYSRTYDIPLPSVILNVFPLNHAPGGSTSFGQGPTRPSVYWYSQVIGPNRGLECAVRAIGLALSKPHLYLRGATTDSFPKKLLAIAESVGAANRLHFLPLGPPSELERLAADYDVGYVGETGCTVNRKIQLTNKQFTYLLAGIPAIISDIPAHLDFAKELAPAVSIFRTEDAQSLSDVLDRLLLQPEALETARKAAFCLGQEKFNFEYEKAKLLMVIERALCRYISSDNGSEHSVSNVFK